MLTRRKFLKLGASGALIVTAGATAPLFLTKTFSASEPGAKVINGNRALVIVELSGGNDALNMVIPYSDPAYYRLRPTLAIGANNVLKLDKDNSLGLHPAMTALHRLYQQGQVAVIQGVGYPNPNYSHFEAHDIWASAQLKPTTERSGWVGRYLADYYANKPTAVSLTGELPLTLYTRTTLAPAINGLDDFRFLSPDYYGEDGLTRQMLIRQIYQQVEQNELAEHIRNSALDALRVADTLEQKLKNSELQIGGNYPETDLARQFKNVVQLLLADLDFRVFYVKLDGFDTHSNQADQHSELLKDLSESLAAFYADLQRHGLADNVVSMTFSEFGRRVEENGSGTDHGSAQSMFILGGKTRGGIYGATPSLTDLDDGNLKYKLDFRAVYAGVLKNWLKVEPSSILGTQLEPLNLSLRE